LNELLGVTDARNGQATTPFPKKAEAAQTGRAPHTNRAAKSEKPTPPHHLWPRREATPERAPHSYRSENAPTNIPTNATTEPGIAEAATPP
jgi:hypothetical protein